MNVIKLVNQQLVVEVAGYDILLPLLKAATSADADRAEAALAEIEDIAENAEDAPSVLNKLNKDGSNVGAAAATLRTAIGSDLAANVNFTQAGTDAITEAVQAFLRTLPISPTSYGASTGSADNVGAITKALARLSTLGGGVLRFPNGSYNLASASLSSGIAVPANVTIDLEGSTLTVTGAAQTDCIFRAENKDRVTIRNGRIVGNSLATGENNGAAISFIMTADATVNISGPIIENIVLDNFKANRWISIQNNSVTHEIKGGRVSVEGISRTGNSQGGTTANLAHVVVVDGNAGPIKGIDVYVNAEATYIKGAAYFFGEVQDSTLRGICYNAGQSGSNDTACYAFALYDSDNKGLRNIRCYPSAYAPRDCGLYTAAGNGLDIIAPEISGQYSTGEDTLPKGGIAINGSWNVIIHGGNVNDCFNNVSIIPAETTSTEKDSSVRLIGVNAKRATAVACRMKPPGVVVGGLHFLGGVYHAVSGGAALQVVNNTGTNYVRDVTSVNTDFLSDGNIGVQLNPLNATTAAGGYRFSGGRISATSTCLQFAKLSGLVEVNGVELVGAGGTAYGIDADGATNIHLDGVVLSGTFEAVAMSMNTCQGTVRNIRANTASTVASGYALAGPSHSGIKGQVVENLDPAATEYLGWVCTGGTTWKGYGTIQT